MKVRVSLAPNSKKSKKKSLISRRRYLPRLHRLDQFPLWKEGILLGVIHNAGPVYECTKIIAKDGTD